MSTLCTLDEAKLELDKYDAADDDELASYLEAVTAPVERICGPVLPVARVEVVEAYGDTLVLPDDRVASVSTVTGRSGPLAPAVGGLFGGSSGYLLDGPMLRSTGLPFHGLYEVSYTAGFATVPPAINLAARKIVRSWWQSQRGGQVGGGFTAGSPEDDYPPMAELPIPAVAMTLLEPYRRLGGLA